MGRKNTDSISKPDTLGYFISAEEKHHRRVHSQLGSLEYWRWHNNDVKSDGGKFPLLD